MSSSLRCNVYIESAGRSLDLIEEDYGSIKNVIGFVCLPSPYKQYSEEGDIYIDVHACMYIYCLLKGGLREYM